MTKYKKINGKSFRDHGWSRFKKSANEHAASLRKKGRLVRVVKGDSGAGDSGWKIYSRKKS